MKLKNIMLLSVCYLAITGCATTIETHNPNNLPLENLSTVAAEDIGRFIEDYEILTELSYASDVNGDKVIDVSGWGVEPEFVSLIPGQYQFLIRCEARGLYNFHKVDVTLEESQAYTAYCLGRYEDGTFGDRLTGMLGFISRTDNLEADKVKNQEIVDQPDSAH